MTHRSEYSIEAETGAVRIVDYSGHKNESKA